MIRHLVLLHWNENASEAEIAAVSAAFAKLPALIAEIKNYQFGPDLAFYKSNADYVVVADFENEADFKTYVKHPDHTGLMAQVTAPIMASFSSAQFQL